MLRHLVVLANPAPDGFDHAIVDAYRTPIDISRGAVRVFRHGRRPVSCVVGGAVPVSASPYGGDAGATESRTVMSPPQDSA